MPDVATLAEIFAHHLGDDVAALVTDKTLTSPPTGQGNATATTPDEPSASNRQATDEDSNEQNCDEAGKEPRK
jgi:hypothetical protein